MSLLLKNVWRNALISGSLSKLRSTSYSTKVSEVRIPDPVMATIRSAPSAAAILTTAQANITSMTHKHMLQALRCLFDLHKAGKIDGELISDPAFGVLCQNYKKHARAIDVSEAVEAVKVLTYLKVAVDSAIVQTMLQIIRSNINFLNLRQIMFLNFILGRYDTKNHLVDALKLALPLAFQIHLPLELDNENLPLLRDMLAYSTTHYLPDRCINNIVTCLLLHDQKIDANTAKDLIWSLCKVNCTEAVFPTRLQLLHMCFDILTQSLNQLSYDDVLRTAAKLKTRIVAKHSEYYHEQLMDAIANYTVQNEMDFERALLIARVLSRIAHTHLGLIEHICELSVCTPTTLSNARVNILFSFINCLSNSNYTPKPDQWAEIRKHISLNPIWKVKTVTLPWTKVCLELASLGYYDDTVLNRIFSREFLDEYLSRESNDLDYIQLLTLYEAVKAFHCVEYELLPESLSKARMVYPVNPLTSVLAEALARGLGGPEYVARNVTLHNGSVVDCLFFLQNGYPVRLPTTGGEDKLPLEQLHLPRDGLTVCIMNFNQGCYSINSNRLRGFFRLILDILEEQGYIAVAINTTEWLSMPSHERTPYLIREVGYKCGEVGVKLSAA